MSDTAVGQALPTDSYSAYNATTFMIKQIVARIIDPALNILNKSGEPLRPQT
jgi:hypothetical protein